MRPWFVMMQGPSVFSQKRTVDGGEVGTSRPTDHESTKMAKVQSIRFDRVHAEIPFELTVIKKVIDIML
jgi:hypothetical protein